MEILGGCTPSEVTAGAAERGLEVAQLRAERCRALEDRVDVAQRRRPERVEGLGRCGGWTLRGHAASLQMPS